MAFDEQDGIIASGFKGFHEAAYPNATPDDIENIKPIFYAGARLVVQLLSMKIADEADLLKQMAAEVEGFGKWFAATINTKGNA